MSDPSLMSAFSKPVTFDQKLESIHLATPDTAVGRIKIIESNQDGYSPDQVLLIFETALTREVRTNPQRRSVIQALKQAIKRATPATKSPLVAKAEALRAAKPDAKSGTLTAVLATSADAISLHHSRLDEINRKSQEEALLPGLCIGLHCLRAHCAFVHNPGKGGRPKKPSTVDGLSSKKTPSTVEGVSPGGFEGWLAKLSEERSLRISKGSAYRAMTALKGLGLDHDATEKQVAKALQQLRRKGPVTLKSLCDAAVEAIGPPPEPLEKIEQSEFQFVREAASSFREAGDAILAIKAQIHQIPDMERALSARLYSLLVEITGSHWKPSDEPDDLANVNPDAIEL